MSDCECHSECDSCNGDSTPKHKYKPSWSAGTLPHKLAKVNKGLVGSRHSKGLQNRVYFEPPPTSSTISNPIGQKPTGIGIARDHRIDLKRAVTEVQTSPVGEFFSTLFLVPKKDGDQRPVLIQERDWLVKIDLKDTYFSIPISQHHRKFLCFQFIDKFYQFNCLPFGLASAPWVFTKTLKPIAALGRELGIRMIAYIDDILPLAETKEKARDQASGLLYLLQCMGFTVNLEKTVLEPSQCLEFLGFMVNTTRMELSLPAQKIQKFRAES